METDRLRQFCTIADLGSLTRAAEVLGISVGGLSKSMKTLEEDLGFSIFRSEGRGLAVSERGLAVYRNAKIILDYVTELKEPKNIKNAHFKIGVIEVFASHFIGQIAQEKFTGYCLEVIEAPPAELEALLVNRHIDCGLTYVPFPQEGIEMHKLGEFKFGAYARPVWKGKLLRDIPFIVPSTGLNMNPLGISERDGWPDYSVPRTRFHRVNMLSTALDFARRGLGAVFMPDFVARQHNQTLSKVHSLVPLELPRNLVNGKRDAFLLLRSGAEETVEIKKFASGVRNLLKQF